MRPEDPLTIWEIRAEGALEPERLREELVHALGPAAAEGLIGLHREADFAFLFFGRDIDPAPWLAVRPDLSLREIHRLRYDQWQDGAHGQPIRLGPLIVLPAGAEPPGRPDPLDGPAPLFIDPGLAFGFGGHPTTRACLEFLLRIYHPGVFSPDAVPASALDLGCGTGVLALAAARLGAERVLAVDHSHLAADAARRNAAANGLDSKVDIVRGLAQDYAAHPAELLMANIPMFVLRDLVGLGAFDARPRVVVSGLLHEEGEAFLELLAARIEPKVVDSRRSDRWVSYLLAPA
jgi:ribosomal protein L11 methyltransferase